MHTRATKTFFCALCIQAAMLPVLQAEPSRQGAHFEIGSEISTITYEESGLMEESGIMYGISGSFTYRAENMLGPIDMVKVDGTAAWGEVDYTSPISGRIDGIDDSIFEARVVLGADLKGKGTIIITPYAGFGFRQLTDDGGGMVSTNGAQAYDRKSTYYYSPVGVEIMSDLENGWSIGGMFEFDIFWDGTQDTYFSDMNETGFTYQDVAYDQNGGYGLRASVKVCKDMGSTGKLVVEPFFRYWDIDNSESEPFVVNGVPSGDPNAPTVEPRNSSTQFGLKVALLF
jgi:hypothetical protein